MKRGFSLVELSIVLVILGLLVGGILAGKSLIRASELRSIGNDFTRYKTSFFAFKDKYFYLPGDMPNAVRFWGAQDGGTADGTDTTCRAVTTLPSPGTLTCNGNGDKYITSDAGSCCRYESFRAWQHLQNAGILEGGLTGVSYGGPGVGAGNAYTMMPGVNIPEGKRSGTGFFIRSYFAVTDPASASRFVSEWGNFISYGYPGASGTSPALTPEEAWNIDTKIDDGRPGYGVIIMAKSAVGICHTDADPALSNYALDVTDTTCSMWYLLRLY